METEPELNVRKIYSMFPEVNPKTVLWRLHKLVQQGKLFKTGRGYYSVKAEKEHHSAYYIKLKLKINVELILEKQYVE